MEPTARPALDVDVIPLRRKRSPWVLVGACATGGVLLGGLVAFKNGKSALAQRFMRARVLAQGVTVSTEGGCVRGEQGCMGAL